MNLIAEFERFQATHPQANPVRESETTAFIQHLSEVGTLGDFTDVDWLRLAEKLGLTDDQYAAMFEGTASWIIQEPIPVQDQEYADWPDELPHGTSSSAPVTRGNPPKSAVRGSREFGILLRELMDEWELSRRTVDRIDEIRKVGRDFEIRMAGSRTWEQLVEE
jgi:hypothetical protein